MEWKDIVGYEGFYLISEDGDIKSIYNYPRKPGIEDGHLRIMLLKNGKRKNHRVHKLVYETFVGEIPEGYDVHHLDENKLHNNFRNLGLMLMVDHRSFHSSGERNARAKFTQEDVDKIRSRYPRESIRDIADSVGTSYRNIHRIVRGDRW